MKKYITIIFIAVALSGIMSCEKKLESVLDTLTAANDSLAFVQVFNATLNSSRNYVSLDGKSISGTAFASGGLYPSTALGFGVAAGTRNVLIRDTLITTTQPPLSFSENFQAGKLYTIFTYDTVTAIKKLTVTSNIVIPTDTTARLRFASFLYSTASVPAVDVFSFRKNINVFTGIPANQVTDFIPYDSRTIDTLYIRQAGTSNLLSKLPINLIRKRSYTAVIYGSRTSSIFINY